MPFPVSPKVIFERNALVQVICQLRFQPILRIDTEIPSGFQDGIREQFPNYTEKIESPGVVDIEGMKIPGDLLRHIPGGLKTLNHEFTSDDGNHKVSLTRTFVALSTSEYRRWSDFKSRLQTVLDHFVTIYRPKHYDRIGLRYINVFKRSDLGLQDDVPWSNLIQGHMLGILGNENVTADVQEFEYKTRLALEGGNARVRILSEFATDEDNNEISYVIDSDFYTTMKVDIETARANLDFLNNQAARLIQWAITPELHTLLGPIEE